jgi:hypothetical protein
MPDLRKVIKSLKKDEEIKKKNVTWAFVDSSKEH